MASNEIYESLRASLKSVVTDMNNTTMSSNTMISDEVQALNESFANIKDKELILSESFGKLFEKELECYGNLISISLAKYYARMAKLEFKNALDYYSILKEVDPGSDTNFNTQLNETKVILSILGSELDDKTRNEYNEKILGKKQFFLDKFDVMKEKLGKTTFRYYRNFEEHTSLLPIITSEDASSFACYDLKSRIFKTIGTDDKDKLAKNFASIEIDLDEKQWSDNGKKRVEVDLKDKNLFTTISGYFHIVDENSNTYQISGTFKRKSTVETNKSVFEANNPTIECLDSSGKGYSLFDSNATDIIAKFTISHDSSKSSEFLSVFSAELELRATENGSEKKIPLTRYLDRFYQATTSDILDADSENGLLISLAILGGYNKNYDSNITLGYVSKIEAYQEKFLEKAIEKINERLVNVNYIISSFNYIENERKTNDENYKDDYIAELKTNFLNVVGVLNEYKNLTKSLVKEFETSGMMSSITLALDNLYTDADILFLNFISTINDLEKYIENYIILFKFQDDYGKRIKKSLDVLEEIYSTIKIRNTEETDEGPVLDGKFYPLPSTFRFYNDWHYDTVRSKAEQGAAETIIFDGIFSLLKMYLSTEFGIVLLGLDFESDEAKQYKLLLNKSVLSACRKKLISIDKISTQPIMQSIASADFLKTEYDLEISEDFKNDKLPSSLKMLLKEIGKLIEGIDISSLYNGTSSLYEISQCYQFLIFKACLKNKKDMDSFLINLLRVLSNSDKNIKMIIFGYAFLELFRTLLQGDISDLTINNSILQTIKHLTTNAGAYSESIIQKYLSGWNFFYNNESFFIDTESLYGKTLFQGYLKNYNRFEITNGELFISSTTETLN